ncbi:uncharacterized protein LOC100834598 [Brachypodium distachyon]|uniref:RING-type domain-containing protein n=1 Tax=Brachypodium distachyon TaxID=15368 RepID=I1HE54_BRADI|nr:uncharacterized protein LOC100834598 [Brachypodium distachyon]XP_010230733.1 uncharacterized protein LOC100834598 [Brachypodium distachyon]XP_010230734.1 uncharacterized protein LOC100834598 [Brachypodium distachyon]KQK03722.1 hypothetical protein BRADI_2g09510v3 [Brachypodium distachyon]KQK03723.1 hypothetical protein BRADI_2g09510v3 [Brachypodium distachyon]KQK03724.1 hypothetical protein BRADI_2g09510v3 [Brachypodium distachyon]KQK03725.1 hypothetical protein BRADI_2g09510v3 [Brachypodi|eukprot:XP_003566616.1 uncharacterized protein LOC100834598 [Brachypodium distachyon]
MGANCCIAAKERPQPSIASAEVSAYRTRQSPSWSFRWDNRTHIEDIMENTALFSNQNGGNIRPELKGGSSAPTEGHSNEDSLSDVFRGVKWQKSDKMEASKHLKADPRAVQSNASNSTSEVNSCKSLDRLTVASDIKTSKSLPSTPPLVSRADPSSSRCHSLHMDSFSMRKARRSPGHQLYRQISDSKIPSLKSFSESSYAEGRPSSSMLSTCSNDLFAGGSQHGGSSDGWSNRTFSELVVSSQRERWSVDSELFGSITSKISRPNDSQSTAFSSDQGICKLCSKLLKERSTWSAHDLGVVAVLFCGHAYHANCLDSITAESEKYDPPCPVCTHGEKRTAKLFGKLDSKIKNRKSKNVMSDTDIDRSSKHQKKKVREPRLGTSSSMKDSFRRPFLKRHFSIGSRPPRSFLGSEPTGKKGFWARHWRE